MKLKEEGGEGGGDRESFGGFSFFCLVFRFPLPPEYQARHKVVSRNV